MLAISKFHSGQYNDILVAIKTYNVVGDMPQIQAGCPGHIDVVPACRSVSRNARIFHFVSILLLILYLN